MQDIYSSQATVWTITKQAAIEAVGLYFEPLRYVTNRLLRREPESKTLSVQQKSVASRFVRERQDWLKQDQWVEHVSVG